MRCDEPQQDFTTKEGAKALAARIAEYWRDRGHRVMLQIEDVAFHPAVRAVRYEIRSDLINGMPRSAHMRSEAA